MSIGTQITVQYAAAQMLYWMGHCAVNTYAAIYLRNCDLSSTWIGILLAAVNGCAVLLQGILSGWLDRNPQIPVKRVCAWLVACALLCSLALQATGLSGLPAGILYATMCIPYTAAQPLLNAMAFVYQEGATANYAVSRGCACGAYSLSSVMLGRLLATFGPPALQVWFIAAANCSICGILWYGTCLPAGEKLQKAEAGKLLGGMTYPTFFREHPGFLLYMVGAAMVFFFHNMQNIYMYRIIERAGGGSQEYGVVFAITSVCEIPASLLFTWVVKKIPNSVLLRCSLGAFFLKGLALLGAGTVEEVYFAQSLQMFALGLYSVSSVYYAEHLGNQEARVKAQALLCDAMFLGACLGILSGGYLLDLVGLDRMLRGGFLMLTGGCMLAVAGVTRCDRRRRGTQNRSISEL